MDEESQQVHTSDKHDNEVNMLEVISNCGLNSSPLHVDYDKYSVTLSTTSMMMKATQSERLTSTVILTKV